MLTLFGILKGLLIQQEFTLEVDPSASTDTRTTLKSKQTDDQVLELPDTSGELVEKDFAQVLTQKEIDADLNTILNIDNDEIKALAGIDATKIADGSVDNSEFQALDGIESNIQSQLDNKAELSAALVDNTLIKADGVDSIQSTGIIVDDLNNVSGVETLSVSGIDNNNTKIINVANPTDPQDVATKDYVDNASPGGGANTSLTNLVSPVEPNQDFNFQNTNKITGLPVPTLGSDAANKDYVDNVVGGANTSLSNLVAPVQPNESFDFQGTNTITGLPTPVNPSDVATKDYVDSSSSASRVVTGSYSSPVLVDEITPIAIAGNSDEDIYVEGTAGQLEFGSWTAFITSQTRNYGSIAYSPTLDLYVAVDNSGNVNPFVYSSDGQIWSNAIHDLSNDGMFYRVIWVPEYGKFFAAGYEFAGGYRVCESSDGMTWTTSYGPLSGSVLNDICYSPTLDLLIGHATAGFYVISEDGGATWTTYSETVSSVGYFSCVWAEELGIFVAVGDPASSGDPGVKISEDGFIWTPAATVLEGFQRQKIVYSSTLQRFVAMSENNNTLPFKLMWSDDGENWTGISLPVANYLAQDIVWSSYHEVFIVISASDNSFFWSYDGITWYQNVISPIFAETPAAIGINETNGIAVILCNGTESQINTTIGANASTFATITDGNVEGQRLTLIGTNSAQQVVLNNSTNMRITQQIKLAEHKIAQFRWNADAQIWLDLN